MMKKKKNFNKNNAYRKFILHIVLYRNWLSAVQAMNLYK